MDRDRGTEDRRRKTEDEGQGTEDRGQKTEDGGRTAEDQRHFTHEELTNLKGEVDEFREMAQRIQAEFQNYRRRSEEQSADERTRYQSEILKELLPVFDNFRRASQHVPDELKGNDWVKGVEGIETQFEQLLSRMGLEPIKAIGEQFDPSKHEAVAQESLSDKKDHEILEEFETGYTLNGQIVRTAKVKINRNS